MFDYMTPLFYYSWRCIFIVGVFFVAFALPVSTAFSSGLRSAFFSISHFVPLVFDGLQSLVCLLAAPVPHYAVMASISV